MSMTIPVYKITKLQHKVPNYIYNIMCGIMNDPLVINTISLARVSEFNWAVSKDLRKKDHLVLTFCGRTLNRGGNVLVTTEVGYSVLDDCPGLVVTWVKNQIANWSK
jgi:hypothetical protein